MDFPTWFSTRYQREGEARYRAIHRLANETGVGWTTVLRATQGTRLQSGSAIVLSQATRGLVSSECMTAAPVRAKSAGPEAA